MSVETPEWLMLGDDVDLTSCDREPLHLSGAIQAHGHLVVLDVVSGLVVGVSAEVGAIVGLGTAEPSSLLGQPIAAITEPSLATRIMQALPDLSSTPVLVRGSSANGTHGSWILHRSHERVVVELEPDSPTSGRLEEFTNLMTRASSLMSASLSVEEAQDQIAEQVAKLFGTERAMVYRFHGDGHGEIVAEHLSDDRESWLGVHYPATDIPLQARALYVRNRVRLIVDALSEPVPIIGHGAEPVDLDLTASQLRSVSPMHIEYMRNMAVRASISLSLVVDGELVGLITCHGDEPLDIPYGRRIAGSMLANHLSSLLERADAQHSAEVDSTRRAAQLDVLRDAIARRGTPEALQAMAGRLRLLVEADMFVAVDGHNEVLDVGPDVEVEPDLEDIVECARELLGDDELLVMSDRVSQITGALDGGILALRAADDVLYVWWRRPRARTITWGGNPAGHVPDDDGLIHPRSSFARWTETLADASEPWEGSDGDLVRSVVSGLTGVFDDHGGIDGSFEHVLTAITAQNRELMAKERATAQQRSDFEDFTALMVHDLRGMLTSMRGHANVVQLMLEDTGQPVPSKIKRSLDIVDRSADHMNVVLADLHHWARAGRRFTEETVDMNLVARAAVNALEARIVEVGAAVTIGELPTVTGDVTLLREGIQNLVENALKYASPDRQSVIRVEEVTPRPVGVAVICVRDNGIGIAEADLARVMDAFQQINTASEGSGLGLSLVAKIADRHGGHFWLESVEGEGTRAFLRLPTPSIDIVPPVRRLV